MSGITAVILTYNKARILPRFVRSLQRQTILPAQVIVVDDASTDNTQAHVRSLPTNWTKIFLPINQGQSNARNVGAHHAKKDYVIFLDGDIEMHRTMLAMMYHALRRNPKVSFAYCHYNRAGTRIDNVRAMPWNLEALRRLNYVSMMSMIRRSDMPTPPFDDRLRRYEDWDLWLRMSEAGKRGVLVNQVLFTAHYNDADISGLGESENWYKIVVEKHGGKVEEDTD